MRLKRRGMKLLALFLGLSLVAAACGSDDDAGSGTTEGTNTPTGAKGGDFIDLGTIVGDPLEHIDPALNTLLDGFQITNAVFDGLTDLDATDPDNPEVVPHVAESWEANEDASEWVFTIREGQHFDTGEEILPSTFKKSWERAAELAGDYSYLIAAFIEGGEAALDPESDHTLSGVTADDEAMTLTVKLTAPYSGFAAVAGFQLFFPVPAEALEAGAAWENDLMFGNGPYKLGAARTDQEIKLVKSEDWNGDYEQNTWDDRLDTITFQVSADPDTSYNAFEAGEGHNANIPPARVADADADYQNTLDVAILGSYHWVLDTEEGVLGGDENLKLRQAISAAVNREEINEAVYNNSRTTSTGVTPAGIPGFKEGLCEYCAYDVEQAQSLFDEWKAEGNELTEPIPLQFNADAGHEPVAAIVIDNLAAIGIEAVAQPENGETYFTDLSAGSCLAMCRAGWFADYPTYDNFMFDLFHTDSIGGSNNGHFSNEEFDALVEEAKATVDPEEQASLYNQAEEILLNEDTGVVPMNWYKGDYVYSDEIANFPQTNFGLILWEQVKFAA